MKAIKRVLCVTLALLFVVLVTDVNTLSVEAASKKKVHKAYEKTIKKVNKKYTKMYKEQAIDCYSYFTYHDINRDGTDELIVTWLEKYMSSGGRIEELDRLSDCIIYTYHKGKVKKVDEHISCFGVQQSVNISKNNKYYSSGASMGIYENKFDYYTIKNGKKKKAATFYRYMVDFDNETYCYTVNGKEVSKKYYEQKRAKYLGDGLIKYYRVNKKNMKKLR